MIAVATHATGIVVELLVRARRDFTSVFDDRLVLGRLLTLGGVGGLLGLRDGLYHSLSDRFGLDDCRRFSLLLVLCQIRQRRWPVQVYPAAKQLLN